MFVISRSRIYEGATAINSIKGSKALKMDNAKMKYPSNVVGFESSSSSGEDDDDNGDGDVDGDVDANTIADDEPSNEKTNASVSNECEELPATNRSDQTQNNDVKDEVYIKKDLGSIRTQPKPSCYVPMQRKPEMQVCFLYSEANTVQLK